MVGWSHSFDWTLPPVENEPTPGTMGERYSILVVVRQRLCRNRVEPSSCSHRQEHLSVVEGFSHNSVSMRPRLLAKSIMEYS